MIHYKIRTWQDNLSAVRSAVKSVVWSTVLCEVQCSEERKQSEGVEWSGVEWSGVEWSSSNCSLLTLTLISHHSSLLLSTPWSRSDQRFRYPFPFLIIVQWNHFNGHGWCCCCYSWKVLVEQIASASRRYTQRLTLSSIKTTEAPKELPIEALL
jgi:hypothetical protein